MNDCLNVEVRDALPDLLHGRLSELDTATMKAHVESCAECRSELEIMREASASALLAPRMDVSRIASAIAPYGAPGVSTGPTPIIRRAPVLRVAAMVLVLGVAGWGLSTMTEKPAAAVRQTTASSPVATAARNTESAVNEAPAPAGSVSIVKAGEQEVQVASLSLVGSTSDLSDAQLEQLVAELDGIETLPSAEPQSITIIDEDFGDADENTDR